MGNRQTDLMSRLQETAKDPILWIHGSWNNFSYRALVL